jgi:hypothetical protein
MIDYRLMRARERMAELQHTADDIRVARTLREEAKAAAGSGPAAGAGGTRSDALARPARPAALAGRRSPCTEDLAPGRSGA